jgi:hypothetical protein
MVALFSLDTLLAFGAEKKFDKRFTVNPGGTFTVRADLGNISVVGADAKEVVILAEFRGRQRDLDKLDLSASQTTNGVQMDAKFREKLRWFTWGSDDVEGSITVKVPKEYNLSLSTAGGNINVKNVNGKVGGGTSGGTLELSDIVGAIDLETSGGDIRASNITGELLMETSGGDIRIMDVKGDVDVNTSGGNVVLSSIEGKIRAETSGGNITVRVKESNKGIVAETSGGNIDLMLPKSISATLDASTSGGEVTCDFPITMKGKFDESQIRGTINGGGNKIYAHTSGGSIRIRGTQ